MKVDVKIAGASYSGVPAVILPLEKGGKARFCEVSDTTAGISDVAKGKKFYTAGGEFVEGTATSFPSDPRKKITVIQKEHETITISANAPGLSSSKDDSGNTVYATEYQDRVSITLKADDGYYIGNITVDGVEQKHSATETTYDSQSASITDEMVISATDAIVIPSSPFTDVSLTLKGAGSALFLGDLLQTTKQSPETPAVAYVVLAARGNNKLIEFIVGERYSKATVTITTGTGLSETVDLSFVDDGDAGKMMQGILTGDSLFKYLDDAAANKTEVTLDIQVIS